MSDADANETMLRLERIIPSSPEDLFALWIEPEQIARWWAPDGYEATVHDLHVRPGGHWRICGAGKDGPGSRDEDFRIWPFAEVVLVNDVGKAPLNGHQIHRLASAVTR